jgi:glycosyltransferase involved in cell wall biosynthesis
MEATARFLRDSGHRVTVSFELQPDLAGVDLVHLFNLTRPHETAAQADHARRGGKPYVLSSVYWDIENVVPWHAYEFPRCLAHLCLPAGLRRAARRAALWPRRLAGGSTCETAVPHQADPVRLQASILRGARLVFPNSRAERDLLLARFPFLQPDRLCVTPNGIAPPDLSDARQRDDTKRAEANAPFVCAGAIGPRKNQLNLVKAFRHLAGERLLIIGQPSPGNASYERAVRRAAGTNVELRGPVPHAEMSAILAGAKALLQPSFIETPGLSAMEAAAHGTPIVVADVAPVREYFGNLAHHCYPDSPGSIAEACREAARAKRTDGRIFAAAHAWPTALQPMAVAYSALEGEV